jgi:hypothetical protein
VDDILIVYDTIESNIYEVLDDFYQIAPKLKFTLQEEMDRRLNFLDINIQRHFSTNIYRKPKTTNSIIPNDSCHRKEQKMAAIHYLYNRMNTYNLSTADMQKEKDTIQQILVNNKYNPSILEEIKNKKKRQKHDTERTKLEKFTYIGR